MIATPNGLPRYRLLTGPDDVSFCLRVSEALDLGYVLYGSPAITFDGQKPLSPKRSSGLVLRPDSLDDGLGTGAATEWPTSSGIKPQSSCSVNV